METISRLRTKPHRWVGLLAFALAGLSTAGYAGEEIQSRFGTPELALGSLKEAAMSGDTNALRQIFGPALNDIANPDPIQRANQLRAFAQHLRENSEIMTQANQTVEIRIGAKHWPFPIPLVMTNGQWVFDTPAGKEEILNRRIGHNELSAMEVCHAYVQAQRDYAAKDRNGNGVMEYARHIRSTPGTEDGLYWETAPGVDQSPFGPLVARAQEEGYYQSTPRDPSKPKGCTPFHGYIFKILKKQGRDAPGGKYDYVINGHLLAGFGLLAYPVEWGNSGVMTFIVNQQGKVYQKNLGENTAKLAPRIEAYNPDATWKVAE